jgi:CheY-like chemotaxis protein
VKIVIVDDNADIRLLVRMQVEFLDGVDEVFEATNGVEAIEVAARNHPDLIILDLDMPVMSGDAALPLLRTVAPAATIVVHSATPMASAPREGLEHADAYLQKSRDDVGDFVVQFLGARRDGRPSVGRADAEPTL